MLPAITPAAAGAEADPPEAGPHRPTFVERVVGLLPLPYLTASLIVAALLQTPAIVLVRFLTTGQIDLVLEGYVGWTSPPPAGLAVTYHALWWIHVFVCLWAVRFIRTRVVAAEVDLAPLLPGGRPAYRRIFGSVSRLVPALLIAVLLAAAFGRYAVLYARALPSTAEQVYQIARLAALYPIYGTAIWTYIATLWGLYRLGREPLRLKPYHESKSLGVKPAGQLSLAAALSFFANLAILAIILVAAPSIPEFAVVVISLTVLASVLFVLPLYSIHEQMIHEKERLAKAHRRRLAGLAAEEPPSPAQAEASPGPPPTSPDLPGAPLPLPYATPGLAGVLTDLRELLTLQAVERQVAAIPTWPFDMGMLGRLATIATAILTGVLTNLILRLL